MLFPLEKTSGWNKKKTAETTVEKEKPTLSAYLAPYQHMVDETGEARLQLRIAMDTDTSSTATKKVLYAVNRL